MNDNTTPAVPATDAVAPATTATESTATRGYFNKEQIEDIALAESVLTAAQANTAPLADDLIDLLNNHRSVIQHAADAIWHWSNATTRPIRKTFALPLNKPLNL